MLLRNFLILLAVCSLASCGSRGPKVSWCIVGQQNFECADYNKKQFSLSIEQVDNFACLKPEHVEALLGVCKQGTGAVKVNYCVVSSAERLLVCPFNDFSLKYAEEKNYACTSPNDTKRLLEYCRRNKK